MQNSIRIILCISFTALLANCKQNNQPKKEILNFSVAEHIIKDSVNLKIIDRLESFLATKNQSATENQYWLASDFDHYFFPFNDLYKMEKDSSAVYKFELLQILDSEVDGTKIVKFACFKKKGKQISLKAIYNVLAVKSQNQYFFSRSLSYNTRNWAEYQYADFTYFVSPKREFDVEAAKSQQIYKDFLTQFFNTEIYSVTYYSCISPEELFEIRGFDYVSNMYMSKRGGLAEVFSGIIFSGNNSEQYDHELVHFFSRAFSQHSMIPLFDEGIATYLGGSGGYSYEMLKKKLLTSLTENNEIHLEDILVPYDRDYLLDGELDAAYVVGGLICEYTMANYGKEQRKPMLVLPPTFSLTKTL